MGERYINIIVNKHGAKDMKKQPTFRKRTPLRLIAAIDIGASAVRMLLAEVLPDGHWQMVENVAQSIQLGKDVFAHGRVLPESVTTLVGALRQFKRLISEYALPEEVVIRAVATSALREADNRDAVSDRIFIATGIQVMIASESDVNRMIYFGLAPALKAHAILGRGELLAVDIGGGITDFLGFDSGNIRFARSTRFGMIRLGELLMESRLPQNKVLPFLTDQINASFDVLKTMQFRSRSPKLVLLGYEARFAARELVPGWRENSVERISVEALEKLARRCIMEGPDAVATEYRILYSEAETLGIALLGYVQLAAHYRQKFVYVSPTCLRDGIVAETLGGQHWTKSFCDQVRASAVDIGEKYFWGRRHAMTVSAYAVAVFDAMRKEHGLDSHDRLILEIAGMLHDIGSFISPKDHHIHSAYLIQHSDIFGLGDTHTRQIAMIARYHRKREPILTDHAFAQLSTYERILLLKLTAILRVADALDRSHAVRSGVKLSFRITESRFEIIPSRSLSDSTVETVSLKSKGNLFAEVFGLQPVICSR